MSATAGAVLDAGALIALDRDDRRVLALLVRASQIGARITIPAGALAQAIRNPTRPVRLSRLVRQPGTDVVSLDRLDAVAVGRLLAITSTTDVIDAHVVVCARRTGQHIVTTDPHDMARLDPDVACVTI